MGQVIFAYRLTNDTGFAPCVDNNILTLACCKGGQVRKEKDVCWGLRYSIGKYAKEYPDDEIYVIGIYKNRLLYCAKATEIIEMTEYYSEEQKAKYGKRKDHIYDIKNGELKRNNFLKHIHADKLQYRRDKNGVYVIISNKFSYFGKNAECIDEKMLSILPKGVGTIKYDLNNEHFEIVYNFIKEKVCFNSVLGEAHRSIDKYTCTPKCAFEC